MEGHVEILKSLVDSLTNQLTNILMKIESFQPVLNRIVDEANDCKKYSNDAINIVKQINSNVEDYDEILDKLPETLKQIESIKNDIDAIKTAIVTYSTITTQLSNIEDLLKPVNKFTKFLMQPMGAITFILTTLGAGVGIVEALRWFLR